MTKPNQADYMFQEKKGEHLVKYPGQVNGFQFKIRNLEDCVVHLLDFSAAVSHFLIEINQILFGEKFKKWRTTHLSQSRSFLLSCDK